MADITDEQRTKAEELGIAIRGRMTAETLQARIDHAEGGGETQDATAKPAKSVKMETVKILKNGYRPRSTAGIEPFLPEDLLRTGDIVDLPEDEVKHVVRNRIATRDIDAPDADGIESWAEHDGFTA